MLIYPDKFICGFVVHWARMFQNVILKLYIKYFIKVFAFLIK